ncbi:MAG: ClbS/DfsB family four-helix bundle protein, partial [Chloroflexota bacterium]
MSDEEWIPGNKAELLASIEREWTSLMNVVEKLDFTQMIALDKGGWSPKDNLAHLAEWMNALMGYHLDRRPRHEVLRVPEEVTKDWDFEVINPVLFERNHNRPVQDVLAELKSVYAELINKLGALNYED